MGTSAEDASQVQQPCPSVCPLCGSEVRLAQCGWMRAMPVCQNAQCLYPMVSELPTPCLARPYTDIPTSPLSACPSASPRQISCDFDVPDNSTASSSSDSHLPIEPDEVFVHTLTKPDSAGPVATAALAAVLCGPVQRAVVSGSLSGGPLAACCRAYAKALRLVRSSLQPMQTYSSRSTPVRRFRNLEMLADVQRLVLKELQVLDRAVAKPLSLSVSDTRDDLYDTLHRLLKSDKRLAKRFQSVYTLRQVCTVCFKQHISRQKTTVLRLSDPAPDFDLYDPAKRVFLLPCHYCRAPQQRVLLRWEKSQDGRQPLSDAVFLEARDGLNGSTPLKSLRTHDGLSLMPTAALQRVARPDNQFYYVIWLFSRDNARWMRIGPSQESGGSDAVSPGLACHDLAASPIFRSGQLTAILFERECPAVENLGYRTEPSSSFTCDGSGRSSAVALAAAPPTPPVLDEHPLVDPASSLPADIVEDAPGPSGANVDELDLLAELFGLPAQPAPQPSQLPPPPPSTSSASAVSRIEGSSLKSRMRSVMAKRRADSTISSSSGGVLVGAASVRSDPMCGGGLAPVAVSGRGLVLSRFLSSAAASSTERRLPAYSEDRHLLPGDQPERRRRPVDSGKNDVTVPSSEPQLKRVRTADQLLDGRMSLLELANMK